MDVRVSDVASLVQRCLPRAIARDADVANLFYVAAQAPFEGKIVADANVDAVLSLREHFVAREEGERPGAVVVEVVGAGRAYIMGSELFTLQSGSHIAAAGRRCEEAIDNAEVPTRLMPFDDEWLDVEIADFEFLVMNAVAGNVDVDVHQWQHGVPPIVGAEDFIVGDV